VGLNEADTRSKLIDPKLYARGWTEDLIKREETAGAIEIVGGKPRKQSRGRVDYTLRVEVNADNQPVAVALIEAKSEDLPPDHGLQKSRKRPKPPWLTRTSPRRSRSHTAGRTGPRPVAVGGSSWR